MKKIIVTLLTIFSFSITVCFPQAGEWVWIKGDSIPNQLGNFGVQGVPSPTNNPPSLYEPCEWTDLNGNFWLFGGVAIGGRYGDLWKYDPLLSEWTWMKGSGILNDTGSFGIQGVPSLTNNPPARGYASESWIDNQGNFWMFGGYGFNNRSDLWKYNISTNEWTWMKGSNIYNQLGIYGTQGIPDSANTPGSRSESAAAWTDNAGDLWLFGGVGPDGTGANTLLNDLWRYNIASNQWTWMKGAQAMNQSGIYGTQGIENTINTPGSRATYAHWKDNSGKLWLFSGHDFNDYFNDLWRYNIYTNNWTWMGGSDSINANGVYGAKCTSSQNNVPVARFENRAVWTDPNTNFWFLGGVTGISPIYHYWNDLWMYCIATSQWIWMNGDSIPDPMGSWGVLGNSNPANNPGGRGGAIGWIDNNSSLYLFGGCGSTLGFYNDIWKYTIDTTCGVCPTSTSIYENNSPNQLFIFPNPVTNELTISNFQFQTNDEIIITDVLGKIIITKKITEPTSNLKLQTSNFSNGIYFIHLNSKQNTFRSKFIKQ